jgi:hypothetical protein
MKNTKMIWIGVAVMAIVVYFVCFKNKKNTDAEKE